MSNGALKRLWKGLSRNWILKLLCLVLAFSVWQGVRESTNFEVVVSGIPLRVTAGDGYAVLETSSEVVSIRFRGSREDLSFISRDQMTVELDISERSDRLRQTVTLMPHNVKTPSRAHAVRFYPPEVTVTIDREVERLLPVKAVLEGVLPEGIHFKKAVCAPASVRLRGAEQLLMHLEQVRTVPIRLDGRVSSFNTHVAISANGHPWTASPERVSVELKLVEQEATRRIENTPVRPLRVSGASRMVQIRPEKVDIILRGNSKRLENIEVRDVVAYVDCTALTNPAEYEVPIRIDVPLGVQVEKIEPPVAQVLIKNR